MGTLSCLTKYIKRTTKRMSIARVVTYLKYLYLKYKYVLYILYLNTFLQKVFYILFKIVFKMYFKVTCQI